MYTAGESALPRFTRLIFYLTDSQKGHLVLRQYRPYAYTQRCFALPKLVYILLAFVLGEFIDFRISFGPEGFSCSFGCVECAAIAGRQVGKC